jgi:hypothetical protein
MTIIREEIDSFFTDWKKNNPMDKIFVSENDIALSFAYYLKLKYKDAKIKFEFPFEVDFQPQFINEPKLKDRFSYLDLLISLEGKNYGFEFKYLTRKLELKQIHENFELKNQGAQDVLRFNFRKDIYRLELLKNNALKSNIKIDKGFAILLTNDHLLYNDDKSDSGIDKEYRFHNSRPIGIRGEDAKWNKKTENQSWVHQKQFNIKLPLRSQGYAINWENYTNIEGVENGEFKYCVVEI